MINSFIGFLGRACLSLIFIFSGVQKLFSWQPTEQFLQQGLESWQAKFSTIAWAHTGLEWALSHLFLVLLIGTLLELVGGLMLFLGISVRLGALFLIIFLAATTVTFHHFWDLQEPQRQIEMVNFMKNLSITGGLLFVLARGKCGRSHCSSSSAE